MPRQTQVTPKASKTNKPTSLDAQLGELIDKAEDLLIEALHIFEKDPKIRSQMYRARLLRAQELVTTLNSEELVRKRDAKKKGKK